MARGRAGAVGQAVRHQCQGRLPPVFFLKKYRNLKPKLNQTMLFDINVKAAFLLYFVLKKMSKFRA